MFCADKEISGTPVILPQYAVATQRREHLENGKEEILCARVRNQDVSSGEVVDRWRQGLGGAKSLMNLSMKNGE